MAEASTGSEGTSVGQDSQALATGFLPRPRDDNRARPHWSLLVLVTVGLLAVIGFAPAARLAADRLPDRPPASGGPVAVVAAHPGPALRRLPQGLPAGAAVHDPAQVYPYALAALGNAKAAELLSFLRPNAEALTVTATGKELNPVYPYQYRALQPILQHVPVTFSHRATALGAALTLLAAQPNPKDDMAIANAGPEAFAVLNRAGTAAGCAGRLDLLLLLAGDNQTPPSVLDRARGSAAAACPGDPTPDWVTGQAQLRDVPAYATAGTVPVGPVELAPLDAAIATFQGSVKRFASAPSSFSGLGDAYLRSGLFLISTEPFTARQDLRAALAAYRRAGLLGDGTDAAIGTARAEIGLGHPAIAAGLVAPIAQGAAHPGAALEVLIDADETAHDFTAAAEEGRRLATLGAAAYPTTAALYPMPGASDIGKPDDPTLPFSTGSTTLAPLSDALRESGGAGAGVQDLSFIPQYREDPGLTGVDTACPSWSWRRDELLAGDPGAALDGWPATFDEVRPGSGGSGCTVGNLRLVAAMVAQRNLGRTRVSRDQLVDEWQNVLRWAGRLPAAQKVAEAWESTDGNKSAEPALQLGEIDFLRRDYEAAAAEFDLDEQRALLAAKPDGVQIGQAELDRGASLLAAGRGMEGTELLRPIPDAADQDYRSVQAQYDFQTADDYAAIGYYADEQLGDYERTSGDLHGAVEDYTAALSWVPLLEGLVSGLRPEAVDNNEALAYLGLGNTRAAAALETRALAADPDDPVFLMSAGFVAERAGQVTLAIRDNRLALQSDPGAFPAANDLGVELAARQQNRAALVALRQAVGANPNYALGWFNLGVLEARMGPPHLPASEGALARAGALEPKLKDRSRALTIDGSIYRTSLDLSKPLPPDWSLAQTQRPAPAAAVGLLAVVTVALGLARAGGQGTSDLASRLVDPINARLEKRTILGRFEWAGWAVAATVVTFLLGYWRHASSAMEMAAYAAGVVILAAAAMCARSVLSWRSTRRFRQRSWVPGIVIGLVTGAVGVPWAPLPYVKGGEDKPWLHQIAPVVLAVTSGVLFLEAAWLHVPLTQSLAVAALIMTASMLLPVEPLDGAKAGTAGLVTGLGAIGAAVLVGLGIL